MEVDREGKLNIAGHRLDEGGKNVTFEYGDRMYLDGFNELYSKINELRQQEAVEQEHFLEPLTDEQWKVMSKIGYPYAPGNAKEHESAPISEMIYWRLAAGMFTKKDAVRAFSTTGYTIGPDMKRTNEILSEMNSKYGKLDKNLMPLPNIHLQADNKDEFLEHVVYGERRYPIYQNLENRLNTFMKDSGVDIPLSHILYGENTKINHWSDLHQVASRAVESILRESGKGDEKLLSSTTTLSKCSFTWAIISFSLSALKAIGYPYFKPREDGGINLPTVDVKLYWQYAAGVISLKDAAREFNRTGWTNFVDEKYTTAKFTQLNAKYGKLDEDLKPLSAQQEGLVEAKENLKNTLDAARRDLGDTILIKPTPVKLAGNGFAKATGVFLAPDGKGGGEYRLSGEYYAVLAVGNGNHTEFDVTKILDNISSVNALTKAVHDAHANILEQKSKQAIRDRITNSWQRAFSPEQVNALNHYRSMFTADTDTKELFTRLYGAVIKDADVASKPEQWRTDTLKELNDLVEGKAREESKGLHK